MAVIGEEAVVYLLDGCELQGQMVELGDKVIKKSTGEEILVERISRNKKNGRLLFINRLDISDFEPGLDTKVTDESRYVY